MMYHSLFLRFGFFMHTFLQPPTTFEPPDVSNRPRAHRCRAYNTRADGNLEQRVQRRADHTTWMQAVEDRSTLSRAVLRPQQMVDAMRQRMRP